MANQVEKLNTIAIANIEAINGLNDTAIDKLNGLEFTGFTYSGITWSTDDTMPVAADYGVKFGNVGAQGYVNCNDGAATGALATYEHDGSSWSTTGNCATVHGVAAGGGTQSAGLIANGWGGSDESNVTEEYNGSTWSTGNNSVEGSAYLTGGGTLQTAQLMTGGAKYNPTVSELSMTQTYNGTNWSNESVSSNGAGSGSSGESGGGGLDAFLSAAGALASSDTTVTQLFNQSGGSWTSKASAPTARRYNGSSTDGVRVYKIGGVNPYASSGWTSQGNVESWVENSWTTENSMPVALTGPGSGSGGLESAEGSASIVGGSNADAATGGKVNTYYIAAAS